MKAAEGVARAPDREDDANSPGFSKELPLEVGNDTDAAGSRTEDRAAAGESASRSQSEHAPSAATEPDAASDQDESDSQAVNGGHEPEQPAVYTPKEGALCTQCPARLLISTPLTVRARCADSAAPAATPQTAMPTGNIFARKSSQGIVTGPRSCAFCSRTFISQHALDIHLSRNMVLSLTPRACISAPTCFRWARA